MATRKHPDAKRNLHKAADETTATPRDSTVPKTGLQKPHDDKEAARAEKARRDAAADAFRNEKAHEPPPRHQS